MGNRHGLNTILKLISNCEITESGCWEWQGLKHRSGYGQITTLSGRDYTHRVAWALMIGPIPEGMVIDHICRNRTCFKPSHLRVTTHRQNILAGTGASARNYRKTKCARGHTYTEGNFTFKYAQQRKWRRCSICAKQDNDRRIYVNGKVIGRTPLPPRP